MRSKFSEGDRPLNAFDVLLAEDAFRSRFTKLLGAFHTSEVVVTKVVTGTGDGGSPSSNKSSTENGALLSKGLTGSAVS